MSEAKLNQDNLEFQLRDITNGIKLDKFKLNTMKSKLIEDDLQLKQIEAISIINSLFN